MREYQALVIRVRSQVGGQVIGRPADVLQSGHSVPLPLLAFQGGGKATLFDGHLLVDAEFFDAFAQGCPGDAEEFGGVNLVASGFFEGLDDELAFDGRQDFQFRVAAGPVK